MISNSIFSKFRFLIIPILPVLLSGCFGDGDGPDPVAGTPKTLMGVLTDAEIIGAQYFTSSDSTIRKTNSLGQFTYLEGDDVTFLIGDIVLGTVTGAPFITPVELTGSTLAVDQAAVNMMVFLQSLDADEFPADFINVNDAIINNAAGLALDFNSPTFSADVATVVGTISPGNAIVAENVALDNFYMFGYQQAVKDGARFPWSFGGSFDDFPDVDNPINLLTNPGFEDSTGPSAAGWDCFNSNFSEPGGPGDRTGGGSNALKQFGFDGGCQQAVDAFPGVEYTASGYLQNFTGGGGGDSTQALILFQLAFFDEFGGVISVVETFGNPVNTGADGTQTFMPEDTWVQVSVTGTAPDGTAQANLLIIHLAVNASTGEEGFVAGAVFWDDMELLGPDATVPDVPLPTGELLTNGSFEAPDVIGGDMECADGWTCFGPGQNFATVAGGPAAGPGPATAQDGAQVLKTFGWDAFTGAFQDVSVIAGQEYTARVYAQNSTADPLFNDVELELFFLDSGDNIIGGAPTAEVVGVPQGFNGAGEIDMGGVEDDCGPPEGNGCIGGFSLVLQGAADPANMDDWKLFQLTATAPANAVKARFQVLHTDASTNQGAPAAANTATLQTGSVFWDNASLFGPIDNSVLIFADEFNDGSLDMNTWNIETGYGPNPLAQGWGNDEWQDYQASAISFVDTGSENVLRITANCPSAPSCGKRTGEITSARITTQEKFSFSTGRVEARIRVPNNDSSWPAFWMLGSKITQPGSGWPKAGEIDILEVFNNKKAASGAIHFCDETQDPINDCQSFPDGWRFLSGDEPVPGNEDVGDQFRIYVMEWTQTEITMTVDGLEYFSQVFDPAIHEEFVGDFFMLLNVAVGGNPVNNPDASTTWPMEMDIDWIRVYQ